MPDTRTQHTLTLKIGHDARDRAARQPRDPRQVGPARTVQLPHRRDDLAPVQVPERVRPGIRRASHRTEPPITRATSLYPPFLGRLYPNTRTRRYASKQPRMCTEHRKSRTLFQVWTDRLRSDDITVRATWV